MFDYKKKYLKYKLKYLKLKGGMRPMPINSSLVQRLLDIAEEIDNQTIKINDKLINKKFVIDLAKSLNYYEKQDISQEKKKRRKLYRRL